MKRTVHAGGQSLEYTLIQQVRDSVRMSALPGGRTRVYAPQKMKLRDIDAMVAARLDEIMRMHAALAEAQQAQRDAKPIIEGAAVRLEGQTYVLRLKTGARASVLAEGNALVLTAPPDADGEARRAILRAYCIERARERVEERIAYYAPKIGRWPGRISIREQKTRWGSCSSGQNMSFNWKLITAPPQALDYVVIHELCHLWEFNHSPRFWKLVEAQMPDYTHWRTWLRRNAQALGV